MGLKIDRIVNQWVNCSLIFTNIYLSVRPNLIEMDLHKVSDFVTTLISPDFKVSNSLNQTCHFFFWFRKRNATINSIVE